MKLVFGACLYPLSDKAGYTVSVPDLPGCVTEGNSLASAIEMAIDAASGWILDELEDGCAIPAATPINEIKPDPDFPGGFVSAIILDMESYADKYGIKAVRKNVTIPNWLNTRAEKAGINFSQILKEALEDKLKISNPTQIKSRTKLRKTIPNESIH
jgi:predicted RNase H-like HicB family nuclease